MVLSIFSNFSFRNALHPPKSGLFVPFLFTLVTTLTLHIALLRKIYRKKMWMQRVTVKKISKSSDVGRCLGFDIGGTLAKVVYFEQKCNTPFMRRPRAPSHEAAADEFRDFLITKEKFGSKGFHDVHLSIYSDELGGALHFFHFETRKIETVIDLISSTGINQSFRIIPCTGGGAHKYANMFMTLAGIDFDKLDELDCLIKGLNVMLKLVPDEVYTFQDVEFRTLTATKVYAKRENKDEDIYPYLLVNIGSGVSILLVDGPETFKRVSGSSIGGGTYWGLCRLLTQCKSFNEALDIAVHGDNFLVDMMVQDIYGGGYDRFDLPATTVASSFGKIMMKEIPRVGIRDADIARALLVMITQNIGQVAYLNACLYKTKRIFFVGNFLRMNEISCRTLAYAIHFWSKGEMEAQFCRHEGYFGALGSFFYHAETRRNKEHEMNS